jgi:hypothetical protein
MEGFASRRLQTSLCAELDRATCGRYKNLCKEIGRRFEKTVIMHRDGALNHQRDEGPHDVSERRWHEIFVHRAINYRILAEGRNEIRIFERSTYGEEVAYSPWCLAVVTVALNRKLWERHLYMAIQPRFSKHLSVAPAGRDERKNQWSWTYMGQLHRRETI